MTQEKWKASPAPFTSVLCHLTPNSLLLHCKLGCDPVLMGGSSIFSSSLQCSTMCNAARVCTRHLGKQIAPGPGRSCAIADFLGKGRTKPGGDGLSRAISSMINIGGSQPRTRLDPIRGQQSLMNLFCSTHWFYTAAPAYPRAINHARSQDLPRGTRVRVGARAGARLPTHLTIV